MAASSDEFSGPSAGGGEGRSGGGDRRRRGRRGGRGRPRGDGGPPPREPAAPYSDAQHDDIPPVEDRRAPLPRHALFHPAPIAGRLRSDDSVDDLDALLEDLDPAIDAALQARAPVRRGDDRGPRGDDRGPRGDDRRPRGDDRGSRGDDRRPRGDDRAPRSDDRGPRGERGDRGFRRRDDRPRDDRPRDDRPRDRGFDRPRPEAEPVTRPAAAAPTAAPAAPTPAPQVAAPADDDFGMGILDAPPPAKPVLPDPFEAPTQETRVTPIPVAPPAAEPEDDGFGAGIV